MEYCADLPVEVGAPNLSAAAVGPVPLMDLAAISERSQAVMSDSAHETSTTAFADHLWDLRGQH